MTKTNAQNLSRRHVAAMPTTKTIAKKVAQQPAPAQPKSTRDKIKSHKISKDSNNLLKNECFPRPTYMSPQRERSYTPLQAQKPYAEPVSDQYVPVGNCFVEPAATMQQFREKIAADRR